MLRVMKNYQSLSLRIMFSVAASLLLLYFIKSQDSVQPLVRVIDCILCAGTGDCGVYKYACIWVLVIITWPSKRCKVVCLKMVRK